MGYHLTIKRSRPITAKEFASAVVGCAELRWETQGEAATVQEGDTVCATIRLHEGELWTNGAEPNVVRAMTGLAETLGGRVFGDEGEWYSCDGEAHIDPSADRVRLQHLRLVRRKRILWNAVRLAVLIVVTGLIYLNSR